MGPDRHRGAGRLGIWLSKALPDDAEAGGGLMVAALQLAIALGASSGGLLFDRMPVYCT